MTGLCRQEMPLKCLTDLLNKIREIDSSIIIMMISGNHDSRQRIGCYGEILEKQGLYMVGIPPRTQEDYIKRLLYRTVLAM